MSGSGLRVARGVAAGEPAAGGAAAGTTASATAAWPTIRSATAAAAEEMPPAGVRTLVAFRGTEPVARLGFGARSGFAVARGTTGFVGWYEAADDDAGAKLLREAAEELLMAGAERVVGPLNGSTWGRYRVALPRDEEIDDGEPFLAEPVNPPRYAAHFERAGYIPHLEYESRIVRHPRPDPSLATAATRLAERGVQIGGIDPARYDEDIRSIYDLSLVAFADNPYYTPIGFAEFLAMYASVRTLVDPALVRLARDDDGRLLGYVFAYPDPLAAGRRVILKTLAAHPDARGLGLGALLTDAVHGVAAARGQPVIHALMQLSNLSKNISRRSESAPFRSYRLYLAERP
jgi:GNAT superfamily N-acetyltransferase